MQATEYGITIRIYAGYDISGYLTKSLRIQRPDRSRLDVEPIVVDEDQGVLEYVAATPDFPQAGTYTLQLVVTTGTKRLVSPQVILALGPTLAPVPVES